MTTVKIGCKLPNGIIMELVKPGKLNAPLPAGRRVKLNGANTVASQIINPAVGAFGLTEVDKDFADEWFKANADAPYVKNGMVFKAEDQSHFQGEALDRAQVRTGLEPLNPEDRAKDPRLAGVKSDGDSGAGAQLKKMGLVA